MGYNIKELPGDGNGNFLIDGLRITQQEIADVVPKKGTNPLWLLPLLAFPLVAAVPPVDGNPLQSAADIVGPIAGALGHFLVESSPGHVVGLGILALINSRSLRVSATVMVLGGAIHFVFDNHWMADNVVGLATKPTVGNLTWLGFWFGVFTNIARTRFQTDPVKFFGSIAAMAGTGALLAEAPHSPDPLVVAGAGALSLGVSLYLSDPNKQRQEDFKVLFF